MKVSHVFADEALLQQALTHPSWANEHAGTPSNQRLEFLGDAVVGLVVTELLFEAREDWPEGSLSRARSSLVNTQVFEALGVELELDRALRTSKGMVRRGKLVADAFEAVVGAVWLDAGLEGARAFVEPLMRPRVAALPREAPVDPRSRLQEWLEGRGLPKPEYRLRSETGPSNGPTFEYEVTVNGKVFGPVTAKSKKQAMALAAAVALAELERA